MKRACIAIVDAAHARLFSYQKLDDEPPRLREVRDLINPGRQAHGMFADTQSKAIGVGVATGRPGHFQAGGHGTVDDHRTDHIAELEARFAKTVIAEIERIVNEQALGRLIVVASPRMLGTMRKEYTHLMSNGLILDEVPQDLAWLTSSQVHDHLASLNLIAPRQRAVFARGARPR